MKINIAEVKKAADGIDFQAELDIKDALLDRYSEIIDVKNVTVSGHADYKNDTFLVNYVLDYDITMPSSRSLEPVEWHENVTVFELFKEDIKASSEELLEEELFLPIENNEIDVEESAIDNILLNIPMKVLTAEEEESDQLPSGRDWAVLTEHQYDEMKEAEKAENNPFAALNGLFDDE